MREVDTDQGYCIARPYAEHRPQATTNPGSKKTDTPEDRFLSRIPAQTPRPGLSGLLLLFVVTFFFTAPPPGLAANSFAGSILFQGNRTFTADELTAAASGELELFRQGKRSKAAADDAAFMLAEFYHRSGFPFTTVEYEIRSSGEERGVIFRIEEGPRTRIGDIIFQGNRAFSRRQLLERFSQGAKPTGSEGENGGWFVETRIRSFLADLRDLYRGEGYLDVRIPDPEQFFTDDRRTVVLTVPIEEGARYVIREVRYRGEVVAAAGPALDGLAGSLTGMPYFPRRKLVLRSRIMEVYGDLGYAEAAVEIRETLDNESGDVILTAFITDGPIIIISSIEISGNEKTRTSFIMNRLAFRPGDLYTLQARRRSFQALYRTGLFSRLDFRLGGEEGRPDRPLIIELQEAPSREVFLEGGWGSYEMLRLNFGFRDLNFRGTGRTVRTEGGISLKSESLLAAVNDPWFLNRDLIAEFPCFIRRREEPAFTREEIGASVLFTKSFGSGLNASAGYSFSRTDISGIEAVLPETELEGGYNVGLAKFQATYDTRDDFFFPTSGWRLTMAAEFTDRLLASEISFARFTAGGRWFEQLSGNTTLGLRYNTGLIIPGRNREIIPLAERFYTGGENTVRSFSEAELGPKDPYGEPVGGLAFNVISLELRHRFTPGLAGTLFTDLGNIAPNRSPAEKNLAPYADGAEFLDAALTDYFTDFRPAAGFGLLYLLPVGPARLDFAFNPDRRADRNEDLWRVHFSVGTAF